MLANFLIHTARAAVSLPNFSQTPNLPAFISSVYSFALTVVGIAIFVQIIRAGFMWLTAAGDTSKSGKGRTMLTNAVIGAILLFAAYLILYIINPDLVKNTFNFSLPANQPSSSSSSSPLAVGPVEESRSVSIAGEAESGAIGSLFVNNVYAQEGIHFFTIRVTDANGDSYDQDYSMEVLPAGAVVKTDSQHVVLSGRPHSNSGKNLAYAAGEPLTILTPFVPDAVIGQPYFAEIYGSGGRSPYVYSLVNEQNSFNNVNIAHASGGANGLPAGLALQVTSEMPILAISNLSGIRDASVFYSTDKFRLVLRNAKPNSRVFIKWKKNGNAWVYPGRTANSAGWTDYAQTDSSGDWINEANFTSNEIGNWQEWAMVDGKISNAIGFSVIDPLRNPTATCAQPPVSACPGGQCWTGHMNTAVNPAVPICSTNGQLPPAGGGGSGGGSGGGGTGTGGSVGGGCVGFGTGPGQTDFTQEWSACNNAEQSRDPSQDASLPACDSCGLQAGAICLAIGHTIDGRETHTVRCTYRNQSQAISCGAPGSGEYCLPGYTNPGCREPDGTLNETPACPGVSPGINPTPSCVPSAGKACVVSGYSGTVSCDGECNITGGTCQPHAGDPCTKPDASQPDGYFHGTIQCNGTCGG